MKPEQEHTGSQVTLKSLPCQLSSGSMRLQNNMFAHQTHGVAWTPPVPLSWPWAFWPAPPWSESTASSLLQLQACREIHGLHAVVSVCLLPKQQCGSCQTLHMESLHASPYEGLLWLVLQPISSDWMSVLQFFPSEWSLTGSSMAAAWPGRQNQELHRAWATVLC